MTNDAKLGMLVGVAGVVVAAVLFGKPEPPPVATEPLKPAATATANVAPPAASTPAAVVSVTPREPSALPTTPVARTRKEADGQPTSRRPQEDEEP